ncbi:protoglobin domain-containing protein [Falsiroseomonas selenitidurans]|uniref:Globin-sensor domain-containing protein n=1 Tax=Falsiroseomonas selenitidurans TaxID=2716335 RepID=A0ABX1E1V4_9PROT|nr:protoglobin domain-containing protein [Falsiroseomonas selenitidurans]NKC29512.1 hypothetical protein [Falsiroseomonas selenitidurans]
MTRASPTNASAQAKRLAAFGITPSHIASLQTLRPFTQQRLPALLGSLHGAFDGWPAMQAALMIPAVHHVRVAHWQRAIAGELGPDFEASAQALASAFYDHGVPSFAVAVCHHSVAAAVLREVVPEAPGGWFDGARRRQAAALRDALGRIAWLDLEALLETYAAAEARSRDLALASMAEAVEREAGAAVAKVGVLTAAMAGTARAMSETASRTGQEAGAAAAVAEQTLGTAQTVAAAAEELTASIGEITR